MTSGLKDCTQESRNWRQKLLRHLLREQETGATLASLYGRSAADFLPAPLVNLYSALTQLPVIRVTDALFAVVA